MFAPDMFQFTPDVFRLTPYMFWFATDVFQFTPDMFQFTTDVFWFALCWVGVWGRWGGGVVLGRSMMCFRAFTKKFRVCVVDGGGVWNLENNVNLSAESLTIVDICNAGELYF